MGKTTEKQKREDESGDCTLLLHFRSIAERERLIKRLSKDYILDKREEGKYVVKKEG
jgi:hypothetical protein